MVDRFGYGGNRLRVKRRCCVFDTATVGKIRASRATSVKCCLLRTGATV
jgi:hypothetical protein